MSRRPPGRGARALAPGWPAELARAAAGPAICALALIGLLSVWTTSSGAGTGTLTKVQIQVTQATVPMRAFTPQAAGRHQHGAGLPGYPQPGGGPRRADRRPHPDRQPRHLHPGGGLGGHQTQVADLAVPAAGTLSLSPLTGGLLIEHPVPFENRQTVPLTLVFRHAGQITVDATVTAPFTP